MSTFSIEFNSLHCLRLIDVFAANHHAKFVCIILNNKFLKQASFCFRLDRAASINVGDIITVFTILMPIVTVARCYSPCIPLCGKI